MDISTYSPALTLIFAWVLMWILMGVEWKQLSRMQKYTAVFGLLLFALLNQGLRSYLHEGLFGRIITATMHLPTFLMFRWLTGRSSIKVIFVILSVLIFTAPIVLIGRVMESYSIENQGLLLLADVLAMLMVIFGSWLIFRKGFLCLLKWGTDKVFCLYSLVPLMYYVYIFAAQNVDLSAYKNINGILLRGFPTLYVYVFYLLLMHNYHEFRERKNIEVTQVALQQVLNAAEEQIRQMNENRMQTAIYRHDMRHHLTMINGFLKTNRQEQAEAYIMEVQENIEEFKTESYCENEVVNLMCSSFAGRARKLGVSLKVHVQIPEKISVSDMELCAMISNGMENALHTAANQEEGSKWIEFSCEVKNDKLLLQIKNCCQETVVMEMGRPVSYENGHGYGCRSIQAIAERYCGQCRFENTNGMFVLRVILPLEKQSES